MGLLEHEEMQRLEREILQAHNSNHKLEYNLCQDLLDIATREQSNYFMAFARLYILYYAMSMRDIELYARHMAEAERSCHENEYAPMLLLICNLNGLYYGCMGDEQSALRSFLEGVTLGKKLGDMLTLAKIYNNIAETFREHSDYIEANRYYLEAHRIVSSHPEIFSESIRSLFLANLADSSLQMGDLSMAERYLEQVSRQPDVEDMQMQLVRASRAALLAARGDSVGALELIDRVLDRHLEHSDDLMLAYEVLLHIMSTALLLRNEQYADRLLEALQYLCRDNESGRKLEIQNLYITCCRTFDRVDKLPAAYEEYYNITTSFEQSKNTIKCKGMKAIVLLYASARKKDEYKKRAHDLESMVYTDELTRLYNRRYFNKLVTKAVTDLQTTRIGFVMMDIDCFKQYNDCYGHTAGDRLLHAAGECLSRFASDRIMPSRYGGDEFACLCVNCTDDEISQYIEKVRGCFAQRKIAHEKSQCSDIATLSIGYNSCYMGQTDNVYTILSQADDALYSSKLHGRNTSTRYQADRSK